MEAGITNEETLRQLGAKTSWLKMRSKNKALSIRVLFALEGAIEGLHEAALPADIRRELTEWFNALPESQGHHSAVAIRWRSRQISGSKAISRPICWRTSGALLSVPGSRCAIRCTSSSSAR